MLFSLLGFSVQRRSQNYDPGRTSHTWYTLFSTSHCFLQIITKLTNHDPNVKYNIRTKLHTEIKTKKPKNGLLIFFRFLGFRNFGEWKFLGDKVGIGS